MSLALVTVDVACLQGVLALQGRCVLVGGRFERKDLYESKKKAADRKTFDFAASLNLRHRIAFQIARKLHDKRAQQVWRRLAVRQARRLFADGQRAAADRRVGRRKQVAPRCRDCE